MKDIYDVIKFVRKNAAEARDSARPVSFAFASLVAANGSSYRRPGARMLVTPERSCIGSLSGGCLEEDVAAEAVDVIMTGQPKLLRFDTRRRFGCHGEISIFVERTDSSFFSQMEEKLKQRNEFTLVTSYGREPFRTQIAQTENGTNRESFSQQVHPPVRLYIIGDGPDSRPIAAMATALGWVPIPVANPEDLDFAPDDYTAAIVKTHNYGRDFNALQRLLPLNLRYVGLMGPRRRRDQLLNHLLDIDVPINAGFFAPAGLDLHSETPAEIALAIVSEIQHIFAGGCGCSLRERKVPIHLEPETTATTWMKARVIVH